MLNFVKICTTLWKCINNIQTYTRLYKYVRYLKIMANVKHHIGIRRNNVTERWNLGLTYIIQHTFIFQQKHMSVQTWIENSGGRDDSDPLELRHWWSASNITSECLSSPCELTSANGDFRFKLNESDKMQHFQESQPTASVQKFHILYLCKLTNYEMFYGSRLCCAAFKIAVTYSAQSKQHEFIIGWQRTTVERETPITRVYIHIFPTCSLWFCKYYWFWCSFIADKN